MVRSGSSGRRSPHNERIDVVAAARIEWASAGDKPDRRPGCGGEDRLGREGGLTDHAYSYDPKLGAGTVGVENLDVFAGAHRSQAVKDRRPGTGVDVAD
jgi:hypothetical protein